MDRRILVVDDDLLQLKLIVKVIGMLKPNYRITSLSNPVEALRLLYSEPFDMLLTDIKMPQMDGLELIRRIREEIPKPPLLKPPLLIILSGFGEFSYAKTAIQYGVSDYLLKPVGKQQMIDALNAAEEKLASAQEGSSSVELEYAVYRLLTTNTPSKADLDQLRHGFPEKAKLCCLAVAVSDGDAPGPLLDLQASLRRLALPAVLCKVGEGRMAVLFPCGATLSFGTLLERLTSPMNGLFQKGLLGSAGLALEGVALYPLFQQLMSYLEYAAFVEAKPALHFPEERKLTDIQGQVTKYLKPSMLSLLIDNVQEQFDRMINDSADGWYDVPSFRQACVKLLSLTVEAHKDRFLTNILAKDHAEKSMTSLLNAATLSELKELLMRSLSMIADIGATVTENSFKKSMELYIANNYSDLSLSMTQAAIAFHYNPSYFSYLFMRHFTLPFKKVLTAYRLEKACELLRNTDDKIYKISRTVGFQDDSYFVKLFSETYHMSPKKYRQFESGNSKK